MCSHRRILTTLTAISRLPKLAASAFAANKKRGPKAAPVFLDLFLLYH
jgi:hypothetical protein